VLLAPDPMAARSAGTDSTASRGSAALIRPLPAPDTIRAGIRRAHTEGSEPPVRAPRNGSTATAWSAKPAASWCRAVTRPASRRDWSATRNDVPDQSRNSQAASSADSDSACWSRVGR
jgi:hypothetical protein